MPPDMVRNATRRRDRLKAPAAAVTPVWGSAPGVGIVAARRTTPRRLWTALYSGRGVKGCKNNDRRHAAFLTGV